MATMTVQQTAADLDGDLPAPTSTTARAMEVIEAVGLKAGGLTQVEVVRQTGCSANLVLRVPGTLVTLGYTNRQDDDRRYVLTSRLIENCQPRSLDKSLVLCTHAVMQWLRDQSREIVQLMIRESNKGLVLEQVSGLEAVQVIERVGMQIQRYSCAPGKAMLAVLAKDELQQWLAAPKLKSFTEDTKSTRSALLVDLQRIRQRGYAEDLEEGIEGVRCVEAAVLNVYHPPVGAITVMSPTKRLAQKRFPDVGEWCIRAAERVRKEFLS